MLPEDVLEIIFALLSPQDRKSAMLVCRSWRQVGELSKFWAWVRLEVTEENLALMPQVLGIERLKSMVELKVGAASEELMVAIERHPGLKVLDAKYCDLSSIEPRLLARVVANLEEVHLFHTNLTSQQNEEIFRLATGDTKLMKLDMGSKDLSTVDPETLAISVAKLEEVDFLDTKLTSQQSQTILRMLASDCKLKKLNLAHNNLSSVDPETLALYVAKLEVVDLGGTNLTSQQTQAIFRLVNSGYKLKKLYMSGINLSSVDPETLAISIAKLEVVDISDAHLTSQQCVEIFTCVDRDCNLKVLNMLGLYLQQMSSVDPETRARVVAKIIFIE